MKTLTCLRALLVVAALQITVHSATTVVPLGANLQTVINAAASGDTLVIEPGTYNDANLNFNRPLKVLAASESGAPSVNLTGAVRIEHGAIGTSTFQGISFGGAVEINEATAMFIDANFANILKAAQANLTLKRAFTRQLVTLTNTIVEAMRLTSQARIEATAAQGTMPSFLAVQSTFNAPFAFDSYKFWLGYSTIVIGNDSLSMTKCDSLWIGNKVSATPSSEYGVKFFGGNTRLLNNAIISSSYGAYFQGSAGAEFINNSFSSNLYITVANAAVIFKGNIFNMSVNLDGPSANLIYISYCSFPSATRPSVGTPIVNCLFGVDPKTSTDLLTLAADSPCINAGMPESIYNNRDGTRNTIGYTGGPYLNLANYSNSNPMVFFLSGPRVIPKSATTIPITAAATAGH